MERLKKNPKLCCIWQQSDFALGVLFLSFFSFGLDKRIYRFVTSGPEQLKQVYNQTQLCLYPELVTKIHSAM